MQSKASLLKEQFVRITFSAICATITQRYLPSQHFSAKNHARDGGEDGPRPGTYDPTRYPDREERRRIAVKSPTGNRLLALGSRGLECLQLVHDIVR
jgi:hypothetical protein